MEEDVLDIIYKIQEARNPKYFLWNIIKNMRWLKYKYNTIFLIGKKGKVVYFNYNKEKRALFYSYDKIYKILELKYHLNEQTANELVYNMVCEHTKLRVDIIGYLV